MASLASLTARLEKLEQQIDLTPKRIHVLWADSDDPEESIERQKRERGVRDQDTVLVVQFVAPTVRDK